MFDFLSQKFSGVLSWLKDRGRLSEENIAQALDQVRQALLDADVPLEIATAFLEQIKQEVIGQKIQSSLNPGQHLIKIVHEKLLDFLGGKNALAQVALPIPSVILVMGLQGSGKTTTIAKLAYWVMQQAKIRNKSRRILVSSVDFYRPAAIEQLRILAEKVGVDFYAAQSTDPVAAAVEIAQHFKNNHYEHLFLDTAGRLHLDEQMMQELIQINAKIAPKYKFLVLDAMTGQESLRVAQAFEQAVGFNSAILTKMDSDTRGGSAFAFKFALKKPISFVGAGEKPEDLESFVPERMTSRILGMGDIMTLIEKAHENISHDEQEEITKKMIDGNFSLQDFANQLSLIDRLGSLQKIVRYLPGMNTLAPEDLERGQHDIKKFNAIISSMTKKERVFPHLLDASRKKRVATGSGTSVQDINQLLQRFEQSKQFVKMFKKPGKYKRFFK